MTVYLKGVGDFYQTSAQHQKPGFKNVSPEMWFKDEL